MLTSKALIFSVFLSGIPGALGAERIPLSECAGPELYQPAKEEGWYASSGSAMGVTGDIKISSEKITFANGVTATIRHIGNWYLPKVISSKSACAAFYEFAPQFTADLNRGGRLCGPLPGSSPARPVRYVAASVSSTTGSAVLSLEVFKAGTDSTKAIQEQDIVNLYCGGFGYSQ